MKKILRLGLFLLVVMLLGLLGAFSWLSWEQANAFVFVPVPAFGDKPANYEDVEFLSPDGLRLTGWFLAPIREDAATILFVHGHGGNRASFLDWADVFAAEGYGILLFDLRARGGSEGEFVTMGVLESDDVVAAFNFLQAQESVNPERIAIFGHSMGAATAILATAKLPEARLVIAAASYTSVRNVLNDRIPTSVGIPALFFPDMIVAMSSYLSGADYSQANPLAVVGSITQPILLMTGNDDTTVPSHHSQILYDAANEPKELYFVEGVNHSLPLNDFLPYVQAFFEHYLINN